MADEPITLAEAKQQLRILDDDSEDGLIERLIVAAREYVEKDTGLILTRREVTETRSGFGPWIDLHAWPIASIDSVDYLANDYTTQTLPADGWIAGTAMRPVRMAARGYWPATAAAPGAVTVTMTAGYATPDAVPQALKQAMLLLIGHWFWQRSASSDRPANEVPLAVAALCHPFRLLAIG